VTRGRRPPALVYGRNPVLEALRAGRDIHRLLVLESAPPESRLEAIVAAAGERGIQVEAVPRSRLDDVAHSDSHQGVVAYTGRREYWELAALLEEVASEDPALLVVVDGVQDPQNLGSIARTAEAVGAAGLVISRNRATEVTPAVAKASAGAIEHLRVSMVSSIAQALEPIKAAGFWVVGLSDNAEMSYSECDLSGKTVIAVGAEGSGLHRLVRERCDQLARLPMLGHVSSLNAAVAASIVLYEALRQRGAREQ
jgi:23S rRNA (guanosine2251-2'-O)-methyltransferase